MSKRMIPLLLALLLALSPVNLALPASAAEDTDMETTVRTTFHDFVTTLNPGSGVSDALTEVFNHIVFGGGKDMNLGEDSAFTGLLLSANVCEDGLVDALTAGFESLRSTGNTSLTAQGSHVWTRDRMSYSYASGDSVLACADSYTGSLNACDEAMVTMGCIADSSFTIARESASKEAVTYTVSLQISSDFDIKTVDGTAIPNQQIQEGLKWVKAMQAIGLGGAPFRWVVTADFSISFPVTCSHTYGDWVCRDKDTHVRICTDCNGEQAAPHSWGEGQPSDDGTRFTYTCTDCGTARTEYAHIVGAWETDFVFPAADFGVEAEDIVFRCTLRFTEGGTVTADWTSVNLTAIKLYFHQMFVNTYYAYAYSAGYTTVEDIEAFCVRSTGMGVSDYMLSFLEDYDMEAMFTPAPAGGTYEYRSGKLRWDLKLMNLASGPSVSNPCTIDGDTMTITPISHSQPRHTMTCTRVN